VPPFRGGLRVVPWRDAGVQRVDRLPSIQRIASQEFTERGRVQRPAASASYRLPQPRRCTAGRLRYASDGTSPATVAASSSSTAHPAVPRSAGTPRPGTAAGC
jgi:hypothetical protein